VKTGENVDRFTILKKLGHGGMGGVFIGFDHQSNELVAVKILFQEYADDQVYVKRFEREIGILKALVHPNIVKLIDSGIDKELHYMALEFVRGKTLGDLIQARKKLPLEIAIKVTKDLARALAYAHANGIVHRDVKPANIMVIETSWTVKILDFGVAYMDDQRLQTSLGRFVGTLSYAAPEQVRGLPADERADLYAMGLVVYEMLTGRKALLGSNQSAILQQQLSDAYTPPSQLEPTVPSELGNLILKLLRAEPQHRYQKADQFLYDLELFESRYKSQAFHARSVYDYPEFVKDFQEANAAFEGKDYETSFRLTQDLARKAPRAAEVFFLLGKIQSERGFTYNAIQEYVKATAFDPDNTYYHLSLGVAYQAIGMRDQARTELETALRLDSNSRIVRQKLDELDQVAAPPAQGQIPVEEPARVSYLDQGEDEKLAQVEKARKEREPIIAQLKNLRPAAKSRAETAWRSALWWGGGFSYLEARGKVIVPTVLQSLFVVGGLYLWSHSMLLQSAAGQSKSLLAVAEFLKTPGHLAGMILSLYALATLYFVNESVSDAHLIGLQGFVIQERSERQWVTVNVGKDRGARVLQIFHIFRESDSRDGCGVLVGRILIKEVGEETCSGPYYPDTRDQPALGLVAVVQEAIRSKLVDLSKPLPGRFPRFDQGSGPVEPTTGLVSKG